MTYACGVPSTQAVAKNVGLFEAVENRPVARGGGCDGCVRTPRQAKMDRVVEYLSITVSPQERLSPPTVEHSL